MSRVLAKGTLVVHPDTPCAAVTDMTVRLSERDDGRWDAGFAAMGRPRDILVPGPAPRIHTDGLWQATCFELFFLMADGSYIEINLSPSGAFAAYRFDHYRVGMRPIDLADPCIDFNIDIKTMSLSYCISLKKLEINRIVRLGASAVIEEATGMKSYWALAHSPGKPDFHHRTCFALELPAPEASSAKVGTGFAPENAPDK